MNFIDINEFCQTKQISLLSTEIPFVDRNEFCQTELNSVLAKVLLWTKITFAYKLWMIFFTQKWILCQQGMRNRFCWQRWRCSTEMRVSVRETELSVDRNDFGLQKGNLTKLNFVLTITSDFAMTNIFWNILNMIMQLIPRHVSRCPYQNHVFAYSMYLLGKIVVNSYSLLFTFTDNSQDRSDILKLC